MKKINWWKIAYEVVKIPQLFLFISILLYSRERKKYVFYLVHCSLICIFANRNIKN